MSLPSVARPVNDWSLFEVYMGNVGVYSDPDRDLSMPAPMGDFTYIWPFWAAAAFGYLLGSIPFGLVLTRLAGQGDVRAIGSGSIGATNVLRTGQGPGRPDGVS